MHIVFLTNEYPTPGLAHGGVGTFVRTLGSELVLRGHRITVVGFYGGMSTERLDSIEMGIFVSRLSTSKWPYFRFLDQSFRLNQYLRNIHLSNPISIVESSELGLALIRKNKGVKYIIRMHGGHHFFADAEGRSINALRGFLEKWSFRKADALIGVSEFVATHTAKYINFDLSTVRIIPNPIDINRFYKADPRKVIKWRIVFVGTVCEKKGIKELVMAIPLIAKRFPQIKLVVAGRDWYFPNGVSFRDYLLRQMPSEVISLVEFIGPIPNQDVPALLESAQLCIFPSHMEAMPIAWLEALAMGKSIVASETGPGPEIVEHCYNGLLCDPRSPNSIAEAISTLLNDENLCQRIGENAFLHTKDHYAIEVIAKINENHYFKLVDNIQS